MNALKADPKTVGLRQVVGGGGYFYGIVGRVLELFEEDEIGNVVGEVRHALLQSMIGQRRSTGAQGATG